MDACELLSKILTLLSKSSQVNGAPPCGPNPVTVNLAGVKLLDSTPERKQVIITNIGTTVIYIVYGTGGNGNQYVHALNPCSAVGDGTGGEWTDEVWTGPIFAFASINGGLIVLTELI